MTTLANNTLTLTDGTDKVGNNPYYLDLFDPSDPNVFIEFLDGNDWFSDTRPTLRVIDSNGGPNYNVFVKLGAGNDGASFPSFYSGNNYYIFGGSGYDVVNLGDWKDFQIVDGTLVFTMRRKSYPDTPDFPWQADSQLTVHSDVELITRKFVTYRVDELLQGIQNPLSYQQESDYRNSWTETHPNSNDTFDANTSNMPQVETSNSIHDSDSIGRLYTAAFGRKPDDDGMNFWLNVVNDPLVSYKDISRSFVDSPEFSAIASPESSSDIFTTALYQNVLGREPDASGLGYWTSQLDSGLQDRADVLMGFANSPENIVLYDLLA